MCDLHCPLPHRPGGPQAPSLYPVIPPLTGVLSPLPITLTARKPSVRDKVLTLAIDTQHPGDITGQAQRQ